MKTQFKILTSVWFLIALFVLLLNDFLLKELFGNWFTSKLSDFTGLLVFGLFWCAVFPKHIKKVLWIIGVLFVLWKSIYSQPFVDTWNMFGPFSINRVVDVTDLIALTVLPLVYVVINGKYSLKTIKIHPVISMSVALFAFCSTSYDSNYYFDKTYDFPFSKIELIKRINNLNEKDSISINLPISFNYENANDFSYDYMDTSWYYNSGADTIIDSVWKAKRFFNEDSLGGIYYENTHVLDTFYHCLPAHRESLLVKNFEPLFYNTIQESYATHLGKNYKYSVKTKFKIIGSNNSSSIMLLMIDTHGYSENKRQEEEVVLEDFEKYFINKLR